MIDLLFVTAGKFGTLPKKALISKLNLTLATLLKIYSNVLELVFLCSQFFFGNFIFIFDSRRADPRQGHPSQD